MKISCDCKDTLLLDEVTEFQGGLKDRSTEEVGKIIKSLKKYGFAFPLFVWKDGKKNWCLDGHGRLLALKKMREDGEKIPPLPVVYVKAKDEEEARNLLLRLNSQYGRMTADSVRQFADGFHIDFEELQLPSGVLDFCVELPQETEGDDDVPDVDEKEEPDSQPGEMYELGNSILMCGDSTDPDAVARLMGGEKADMVVTDPPYNVAYEGKTKEKLKIQNDKMESDNFRNFLVGAFTNMRDFMKEGASFYIWYASSEVYNFQGACDDIGLKVRQELVWNKNSMVLSRQDYQWKHEPCLYGWKEGSRHNWYGDRKQTTVIDCKRPKKSLDHPTMKPVELFEYQIQNSSIRGGVILDLFGGSGTTIIASEKTGRCARVMELDPHYCDVIRRRYTKWALQNNKPLTSGCLQL